MPYSELELETKKMPKKIKNDYKVSNDYSLTQAPISECNVGETISKNVSADKCIFSGENSFAIYNAKIKEDRLRDVSMKGTFPIPLVIGKYYRVTGVVYEYQGQKQIDVKKIISSYPTDETGITLTLEKQCRFEKDVNVLFKVFGDDVFGSILTDVKMAKEKIKEYNSNHKQSRPIKPDDIQEIFDIMTQSRLLEESFEELQDMGFKPAVASAILKIYGAGSVATIKDDPYQLLNIKDLNIEFKAVDLIALQNGYAVNDSSRLKQVALHLLNVLTSEDGHTLFSKNEFWDKYPIYSCKPLGALEAKKLINEAQSEYVDVQIGENVGQVSVIKLREALSYWQGLDIYKRGIFEYPRFHIDRQELEDVIQQMISNNSIKEIEKHNSIYYQTGWHYTYEKKIATLLNEIHQNDGPCYDEDAVKKALQNAIEKKEEEFLKKTGTSIRIQLEPEQEDAILNICRNPYGAYVLTGPAGSGKTFIIDLIIKVLTMLFKTQTNEVLHPQILTPTGKAAQVASQATGLNAVTIHRHFGIIGDESKREEADSVTNMFLIDEFSMVDSRLLSILLEQIQNKTKIIFQGDIEQLASVAAGSCLRDLIKSAFIPHYHLCTTKRQSSNSGVLINANKIIRGEPITSEIVNKNQGEMAGNAYICQSTNEDAMISELMKLTRSCGLAGFQQEYIQILCPTKTAVTGTNTINYLIQQELNPYKENPKMSNGNGQDKAPSGQFVKLNNENVQLMFHVGDKVMNTKNNYEINRYNIDKFGIEKVLPKKGIMNGETGVITSISKVRVENSTVQRVVVRQTQQGKEDEYLHFDNTDIKNLILGYAITIHKSQGSQWPIVACPLLGKNPKMLTRQLLYTMYTRAQSSVVIYGDKSSVDFCINNPELHKRQTGLAEAMTKAFT